MIYHYIILCIWITNNIRYKAILPTQGRCFGECLAFTPYYGYHILPELPCAKLVMYSGAKIAHNVHT